jgi:hypothetical protein
MKSQQDSSLAAVEKDHTYKGLTTRKSSFDPYQHLRSAASSLLNAFTKTV